MSAERTKMINALKEIFVPEIKILGFTGSFPHFRKIEKEVTNLITFQFDRNGGGFIIEIANYKGDEFKFGSKIIPLNKLDAHYINKRKRIYPNSDDEPNGTDDWFRYDKNQGFENIAEKVVSRIPKMEKYWSEN
jgi:hypothetical protein